MRWGPRGDQRFCHHRANLNFPGLVYAYDVTCDYTALATDVPIAAVEVLLAHFCSAGSIYPSPGPIGFQNS